MHDNFWKWMGVILLGFIFVALSLFVSNRLYRFFLPKETVLETARTVLLKVERESSLVTTRAYVQAVVRKRDEQWYGNAEVIRIVPATISYAVNLAEIDNRTIEYDEQMRTLYIQLPDVKIHSIDPDMSKAETIRNIALTRSESMTGNVLEEETEKMVRPAIEELGKSPEIISTAKDQAIVSVRQLLESTFKAAGMQVQVIPYFKEEGKSGGARNK